MASYKNFFKRLFAIQIIALLTCFSGCTPELSDDPIPYVQFSDVVINLNLPSYFGLKTDGGYAMLNDGGTRGIILYRKNASTYIAYERNCTFQPADACATVDVHSSGLYMEDPCCQSIFNFSDGQPSGGPAWRALRKYQTILNGTDLTITDEVVN